MHTNDPRKKFSKPGKNETRQAYPGLEERMHTKPIYDSDTYKGSGKLKGKKAIITGGDSGIGRAVAVSFAKEGADILISYLEEEEQDAQVTKEAVEACGRKVVCMPGNLNDATYCKELIEHGYSQFGAIDILVNNAALQKYFRSIEDITAQDFLDIYDINVVAPFLLTQYALPYLRPGSSIINTASTQAYEPSSLLLPYAASKGALVALTKALAEELIEKGIRVNAVAPGPIWSPLNTHGSPEEKLKRFGESSLFERPGQPIEVSPVFVLLASDEGSFITGEVYGVTGGKGVG